MGESKKIVAASLKTKFNALKRLKGKLLKKKKKRSVQLQCGWGNICRNIKILLTQI